MAEIATCRLPCPVCDGQGHVPDPDGGTLPCKRCYGKGRDVIAADQRLKACAELAQYLYTKRKAVEHSGPDGEELSFRVMLEKARKRARMDDDDADAGE